MEPILKIDNVSKLFSENILAVNDMNLELMRGEIFTLLGGNGAGKTTTLSLVLNFIEPTKGSIWVDGISVTANAIEAKRRMAYVSENVMLYGNLSALENLKFFTEISVDWIVTEKACRETLRRVGLPDDVHNRRVGTFSKGMRQKCGIAIAIEKKASLLLLDEPTSGLDPQSGLEFQRLLLELRKEGRTILMTSHDIFRAREISDRIGIMKNGSLVKTLSREAFVNRDLTEVYMETMNYAMENMDLVV